MCPNIFCTYAYLHAYRYTLKERWRVRPWERSAGGLTNEDATALTTTTTTTTTTTANTTTATTTTTTSPTPTPTTLINLTWS